MTEQKQQHCGLVAVIGAPNAGKSTLVNALVGQKVAITSAKAQTTRARMLGIALDGDTQMILVDTPGIFAPKRRLDRAMVSAAWEGAEAADAVLLMVDPVKQRRHELEPLLEALANRPERKILVLNNGRIEAYGSHQKLMEDTGSLYYQLFTAQAKNYQLEEQE